MFIERAVVRTVAALVAASATSVAVSQDAPPRALTPELEALNPPVPADLVLSEARRTPAEKKAAAYSDRRWTAPRTSWGHPSLQGTWSTDDMRGIPVDRPEALGTQEFLAEEQFIDRARRQQAGSDHADNVQTFHRVAYGSRVFGFSSLVVDPPDADVTVGRWKAAADGTFTLPIGTHVVDITRPGFSSAQQEVTITEKDTPEFKVTLERLAAVLTVTTSQEDVEITLDGQKRGTTALASTADPSSPARRRNRCASMSSGTTWSRYPVGAVSIADAPSCRRVRCT